MRLAGARERRRADRAPTSTRASATPPAACCARCAARARSCGTRPCGSRSCSAGDRRPHDDRSADRGRRRCGRIRAAAARLGWPAGKRSTAAEIRRVVRARRAARAATRRGAARSTSRRGRPRSGQSRSALRPRLRADRRRCPGDRGDRAVALPRSSSATARRSSASWSAALESALAVSRCARGARAARRRCARGASCAAICTRSTRRWPGSSTITRGVLPHLAPDAPETEAMHATIAAIVERADRVAGVRRSTSATCAAGTTCSPAALCSITCRRTASTSRCAVATRGSRTRCARIALGLDRARRCSCGPCAAVHLRAAGPQTRDRRARRSSAAARLAARAVAGDRRAGARARRGLRPRRARRRRTSRG